MQPVEKVFDSSFEDTFSSKAASDFVKSTKRKFAMFSGEAIQIRTATADDANIVASHRRLMFEELGHDVVKLDLMERQFSTWVRNKLNSGEYLGWLAIDEHQIVQAGAGLWIREWIINPNDLSGKEGYVCNLYTEPAYRCRGCARALMQVMLAWCQTQGIGGMFLRPSEAARGLYLSLGFEEDNVLYKCLP
jgi:GNAT superfamily N-acetyltransferase